MTSHSDPEAAPPIDREQSLAAALRTVLLITEAVNTAKSAAELVERALDAIVAYTRFPSCGLFQLDASGTRLEMVGRRNVSDAVYERARYLPLDGSLTGQAIKARRVLTTSDLANDVRLEPQTQAALAREGFVEVASVPLIYRDKALGTVNLIYHAGDTLSDPERDTLLGVGHAIASAWAHRMGEDERDRLQEQLRKAEQIEQLGLLAGGLAHDFNNYLTGILGGISFAKELILSGVDPKDAVHLLDGAEKASLRAAALVQQLLTFSKGGAPLLQPTTQLAALIRESAEFLVHGRSTRLVFDIDPELAAVEIDAAQISRMVQNLVLNAIQASPPGGAVTVGVKQCPPKEPDSERAWVRISVTDQGSGIPPAILPHIFEPYYTTKSTGSGLGLPTVQSIVRAHGGTVEVSSEVGMGTTFVACLPGSLKQPPEVRAPASLVPDSAFKGRALVLDDDETVRELARRLLEHDGYDVVTAAEGRDAIRACEDAAGREEPFALAVLDLTVAGGVGGKEALPRIRALIPNIAVVVCSGYSENDALTHFAEHGFDAILPKPYTLEQFARSVRTARGARAA